MTRHSAGPIHVMRPNFRVASAQVVISVIRFFTPSEDSSMASTNSWSQSTADRFTRSLEIAADLLPASALDGVPADIADSAVRRVEDEHWVNLLQTVGEDDRDCVVDVDEFSIVPRHPSTQRAPLNTRAAQGLLATLTIDRAVAFDIAGRRWSSRLAPSAGGTHSIRPLLYARDSQRWYRSSGDRKRIDEVLVPGAPEMIATARAALQEDGGALIFAVAEPDVIYARYPGGESLLWRDAGAFLATVQFAARARGAETKIAGIAMVLEDRDRSIPAGVVGAVALWQGSQR